MEQPRTECNFDEQQRGNVESQSLNLPIRAPFPGTRASYQISQMC